MSPRLVLTVALSAVVLAVFVGLGLWQLQRLQWKQAVLAEIEARIGAAPVAVPAAPDPLTDRYLPVTVRGWLDGAVLRVLVSTRQAGPGYRLISALETGTGAGKILVDRGYIRVSDPLPDPPAGVVTITGNLHWPDDRNGSTPANQVGENTWFARDIDQMAAVLGTRPVLLVVAAMQPPEPGVTPLPVTAAGIRNDHLEYAITWFLLAATWVVMTGFAVWRIKRRNET